MSRLHPNAVLATALLLAAGTAHADIEQAIDYIGDSNQIDVHPVEAEGSLAALASIDVDFTNITGSNYAGDLAIGIIDPSGNAVEFGGADLSFDGYDGLSFANAGGFPGSWNSTTDGSYSHGPVDLSAFGLSGSGTYRILFRNGFGDPGAAAAWSGSVVLEGLDVPLPMIVKNVTQDTEFATLQEALDDAVSGDVIEIEAGTLNEWGFVLINKDVTIRGHASRTSMALARSRSKTCWPSFWCGGRVRTVPRTLTATVRSAQKISLRYWEHGGHVLHKTARMMGSLQVRPSATVAESGRQDAS